MRMKEKQMNENEKKWYQRPELWAGAGFGLLALYHLYWLLRYALYGGAVMTKLPMVLAILMHLLNAGAFGFLAYCLLTKRRTVALTAAGLFLAVGSIYVIQSLSPMDHLTPCVAAAGLTGASAWFFQPLLKPVDRPTMADGVLFLAGALLLALTDLELLGLSLGRVLLCVLLAYTAYERGPVAGASAGLGLGLTADLCAGTGSGIFTAGLGLAGLMAGSRTGRRRSSAALAFLLAALAALLPSREPLAQPLLLESAIGAGLFLMLPGRLFGGKRLAAEKPEADAAETEEAERSTARRRLSATALALRELYDSLMRTPKAEDENPAMIFDRAAERVCRGCSLRTICWERDYAKTYNALNDATPALLTQGRGRGGDFPSYFTDRCIRFPSFLSAVNSELSAFLLRRQYRGRLADTRAQAAGQYAQLSELLSGAAETLEVQPTAAETLLTYRVGAALRPKEGENVSGDSVTHFETEDGRLCLLLSDGMGCGEEARRESALAVRLLERFLRAGVETSGALKTLNSALTLRAEVSESFTTIDLLTLSLRDGAAEVYKYGAAPSYVKRGARVRRITGSCLPAGLQSADTRPETTGFTLEKGSFFVMLSDGVADVNDDGWLMALLEKFQGDDPQALASAILAAGRERRGGDDDCAVLALYRDKDGGAVEV